MLSCSKPDSFYIEKVENAVNTSIAHYTSVSHHKLGPVGQQMLIISVTLDNEGMAELLKEIDTTVIKRSNHDYYSSIITQPDFHSIRISKLDNTITCTLRDH